MKKILILLFIAMNSLAIIGQEEQSELKYYSLDERKWLAELPIWIPGFRGQLALGDLDLSSTESDNDKERSRVENEFGLEFYFVGRLAYQHKNWWFHADGFSGRINYNYQFDRILSSNQLELLSINIQMSLARMNAGYRVLDFVEGDKFSLEVIPTLGMRYYNVQLSGAVMDSLYFGDTRLSWWTPIVGLYLPIQYKRWQLSLLGDYGFADNTTVTMMNAQVHYRISPLVDVNLGWTHLDLSHETHIRDRDLKINIVLTGPTAGVGFRF